MQASSHGLILTHKRVLLSLHRLLVLLGVGVVVLRSGEDIGGVLLHGLGHAVLFGAFGLAFLRLCHQQLILLVLSEVNLPAGRLVGLRLLGVLNDEADSVVLGLVLAALARVHDALLLLLELAHHHLVILFFQAEQLCVLIRGVQPIRRAVGTLQLVSRAVHSRSVVLGLDTPNSLG